MESWAKNKFLTALLFLIVVLQSGHALQTIIPSLVYLIYIPALLGTLYLAINIKNLDLKDPQMVVLVVFSVMIACTMIADIRNSFIFYLQFFSVIIGAFVIVRMYRFKDFTKLYLTTMTVVTVIAVIGYLLVNTTLILDVLPKINNTNDVKYGVGIIFNYITTIPERNCGMFWEPSLFATHLIIATVLELMTKEKANPARLVLFSLGIFTANSSAGFALYFLCIFLLFVRKIDTNLSPIKSIFAIALLVLAIILIVSFDSILAGTSLGENEYFKKLSTDSVSSSSRMIAAEFNWKIFLSNPIFGAGYIEVAESISKIHVGDTSTSLFMMSIFGILGCMYTGFIAYGIFRNKKLNIFSKILILAIALVIVNKEPHYNILLTWILIFYLNKNESFTGEKSNKQLKGSLSCVGV